MFNFQLNFQEEGFPVCDKKPDKVKDHVNPLNNPKGMTGEQHLCLLIDKRFVNLVEIRVLKPYEEPVPKKNQKDYPFKIWREWFDEFGNPWGKPGDDDQVIGFIPISKVPKSTLRLLKIAINEDW